MNRETANVFSLMADGLPQPKRLVTHRLPYTRMVEAYEMACRREKAMPGVIFQWKD